MKTDISFRVVIILKDKQCKVQREMPDQLAELGKKEIFG